MSLFENDRYQWRETYFVLFQQRQRPTADKMVSELEKLGSRYEIKHVRAGTEGEVESLTVYSPYDFAAMDITYLAGDEVTQQVEELYEEMKQAGLSDSENKQLVRLRDCDARFDVYHFEELTDDEEEFLDPGALLIVLERLTKICQGVGVDPQSGALM